MANSGAFRTGLALDPSLPVSLHHINFQILAITLQDVSGYILIGDREMAQLIIGTHADIDFGLPPQF